MDVLLVGAGVIGTVFGTQLSATGHRVSVLAHGRRTRRIEDRGLRARDAASGVLTQAPARVVDRVGDSLYDLVLVTVRREQIDQVVTTLADLAGRPTVAFSVNNPHGRARLAGVPGTVVQAFPGLGGAMDDDVAVYRRTFQQPTTVEAHPDPVLGEFCTTLARRGFAIGRTTDMDGWLTHHAAAVVCLAGALRLHDNDPVRLAADRSTLTVMCRGAAEAFAVLRAQGVGGLPLSLSLMIRRPVAHPVAVLYFARLLRSPVGELCLASHARTAGHEIDVLADDVLGLIPSSPSTRNLYEITRLLRR